MKFSTIAAAALAGLPPLAGFFSKDAILIEAFNEHKYLLYGIGLFTALLTAVYSFKIVFIPFWGQPRDKKLYDPRAYLKKARSSMAKRVVQACKDLRSVGTTLGK